MPICRICKKKLTGRSDKKFCSLSCKNSYHAQLRKATETVSREIDNILHRNRSIMLEIMGKTKTQIKIPRLILDKKKFSYIYHTHSITNSAGKVYHFVYDFAWMTFSDDEVLIIRKK